MIYDINFMLSIRFQYKIIYLMPSKLGYNYVLIVKLQLLVKWSLMM